MSLKNTAIKGFFWDFAGTFANHGIKFIISIFLARLLDPAEFGLVGMALVFIIISQAFADLGFGSALIQNKKNSSLVYSSVFYINILVGGALCVLFWGLAPAIATFYNNTELSPLIQWLSLSFVFSSFVIVQRAQLARSLDFRKISVAEVISQIIGGVIAIILAFWGWGPFALVVQNLVSTFLNGTILWIWSSWHPRLEFSWKEVKRLVGFSGFMFLDNVLSKISHQLDVFFVGKMFSPATLGFYTRAQSLNSIVVQYSSTSFSKVFFPVLSKYQDDDVSFKRVYLQVASLVCFLAFLISGLMVFWGETIIIGLFGPKWEPSVFIFQLLILGVFARPLNVMMVNAFLGKGMAKANFQIGLLRKFVRLIPLLIGYYYGLTALIVAMVVVAYILAFANMLFMKKLLDIDLGIHLKRVFEGAVVFFPFIYLFFNISIFEEHLFNSLIYSFLFVMAYIVWNMLIGNKGLQYLKNNMMHIYAKFR